MTKQLCLKQRDGEPPILTLRDIPQPGEEGPSDVTPLENALIEATSRFDKDSAAKACEKVAELCKTGAAADLAFRKMLLLVQHMRTTLDDVLTYLSAKKSEKPFSEASARTLVEAAVSTTECMLQAMAESLKVELPQEA